MSTETMALIGVGVTAATALAVVAYLTPHLRRILTDLCGTEDRAGFWTAFSNTVLVLVPLVGALFAIPDERNVSLAVAMARQIRLALIGEISAVCFLGAVINSYIPKKPQLEPGPRT